MNIASLIPFAPYLTILYVVFALIQVLRRQHQGIVALILALIVLVAPIAAYFLSSNVTERLSMINAMAGVSRAPRAGAPHAAARWR